jgi:alkylated DNA nucleotide flippase Atl1
VVTTHLPDYAERVLEVTERIPPGRVMSYGDIAEYLGEGGPRQVGRVMSQWGGAVAWWRVIHADGSLLAGHEREALSRYLEEGTPLRRTRDGAVIGVNMRQARWPGHS